MEKKNLIAGKLKRGRRRASVEKAPQKGRRKKRTLLNRS